MVGVCVFIVVVLENSFKHCAGLIAQLLAHEHTLLMCTYTHTQAISLFACSTWQSPWKQNVQNTSGWDIFKFQRNGSNNRNDKRRKRRELRRVSEDQKRRVLPSANRWTCGCPRSHPRTVCTRTGDLDF